MSLIQIPVGGCLCESVFVGSALTFIGFKFDFVNVSAKYCSEIFVLRKGFARDNYLSLITQE